MLVGSSHILIYQISCEKVIATFTRPSEIPTEFKLPRSHYHDISFVTAAFSPDDKFVMATIFRLVYLIRMNGCILLYEFRD